MLAKMCCPLATSSTCLFPSQSPQLNLSMLATTFWPCMLAIPLWPGIWVGVCVCVFEHMLANHVAFESKMLFLVHVGQHSGSGHK